MMSPVIVQTVVDMNQALRADSGSEENPAMINRVLEQAVRTAKHDYLVAIISDFDGANEDTRRYLLRMSQHNDVIGVLVHDPSATDLPPGANLVATNGELQVELDMGKGRVYKDISEMGKGRVSRVLEWQKEIGVPMLPIHTAEDVATQVQRLLGYGR